ncbi:EamA family transporter [Paenibacillus sp. IB182496]|uniref:EamA family transporter n=1 Tax=Paenibacillus sabuli TaxID=2772509 RepID=A0A927GRB7_9BACL|nr:EamA family transporter [Paenibacillus sabuli]MBD2844785.1 EamA family transporter [Paenibacillus sabuli]
MWLIYALLAAVCFGFRGVLYHWASKQGLERNLMLLGVFAGGAVLCLVPALLLRQPWETTALAGVLMGTFSFVANACIFKGFAVGKASLIAILTGLPPVVVLLLAYVVWGEAINVWQLGAFALIVAGILLVRYSNDLSLRNLQGAQWGLLAMLFFGFNDMAGKLSTRLEAELFPTLVCMFVTGCLWFGGSWLLDLRRARSRRMRAPAADAVLGEASSDSANPAPARRWTPRRTFFTGMLIGTTNAVGMIVIINAFAVGITGLVSAVVALNVLIILLYSRVVLKERFGRLEIGGMATAIVGLVLLRLFELVA